MTSTVAGCTPGPDAAEDVAASAVIRTQTRPDADPPPRSTRRLAAYLMGGALASKLLGFAREILMAQILGASLAADGFRGAVTAVLLPLSLLQSESVPAILVPMHREWQRAGHAPRGLTALTVALTLMAAVLMLAIEALGPVWVGLVVGGFTTEGQALTLDFVRVMALGMPASTLVNCLAAGEIALGRPRLMNIRASLLNVSILLGLMLLLATGRLSALAWSFAVGFNALGIWGVWSLWREGVLSAAGLRPAVVVAVGREFLWRLRPLLILPVAEQAQVWIERVLASRLAVGSMASLDYARSLSDSAVMLISQPIGLAVLSRNPGHDIRAQMEAIARPVLAVALPVSIFLALFAPDVVRLVFHRGAFTETGVLLTGQALRAIAAGLWAATLGWILLRMMNSLGRNGHAAIVLGSAYGANIAVNLMTAHLQAVTGDGPLLLGSGEAVRGIVLLGGCSLALGCGRELIALMARLAAPILLAVLSGWWIHAGVDGGLARLSAAGGACAACIALGIAIVDPAAYPTAFGWLDRALAKSLSRLPRRTVAGGASSRPGRESREMRHARKGLR